MKKRILVSLLFIGMIIIGAGLATYAWFTSTAASNDNVFTTGTLKIGLDTDDDALRTVITSLSFNNISPGWQSEEKIITVQNNGTLPFNYSISMVAPQNPTPLYSGTTPLQVSINGSAWRNINAFGSIMIGKIDPNNDGTSTGDFRIQFRLPGEADDSYQGISQAVKFRFNATQLEN